MNLQQLEKKYLTEEIRTSRVYRELNRTGRILLLKLVRNGQGEQEAQQTQPWRSQP